jgi:hypothetical protein
MTVGKGKDHESRAESKFWTFSQPSKSRKSKIEICAGVASHASDRGATPGATPPVPSPGMEARMGRAKGRGRRAESVKAPAEPSPESLGQMGITE